MNRLFRLLISCYLLFGIQVAMAQPKLILDNVTVQEGDVFELELMLDDAPNIDEMKLYMVWNPDSLSFKEITAVNGAVVAGLSNDNFDNTHTAAGQLVLDWKAIAVPNISFDSTWVFRVSFTALLPGQSQVTFDIPPNKLDQPRTFIRVQQPGNSNGGTAHTWELLNRLEGGIIQVESTFATLTPPPLSSDTIGFYFKTDKELLCIGEQICYTLQVENFDSIVGLQTPIFWDPTSLRYSSFSNEVIDQVSVSNNFGEGAILLTMDLTSGTLEDQGILLNGLSLDDGASFVDICFEVVGVQKNDILLEIGDTDLVPTNLSIETNQGTLDYTSRNDAFESINCDEVVILNTLCGSGSEGEEVCVTVRANNLPDIGDFLYSHTWDPTIMDFVEIRSVNAALSELGVEALSGTATVSWFASGTTGVTLSQNNTMYDICFRLKEGVQEGQNSAVTINQTEWFFNDIDGNPLNDFRPNDENCQIEVEAAPLPVVNLSIADTTFINEGSTQCVDIVVENFEQVDFMSFPLTWDANVLRHTGKSGDQLDDINIRDIAENEIIVEWSSPNNPVSLADGTAIVSICFEAIGKAAVGDDKATSESALVFSGSENILITRNNVELDYNPPSPGLVVLNAVAPSAVSFVNDQVINRKRGESFCVPVTAANFQDIATIRMFVTWDSTVLQYEGVQNFNDQFPLPIEESDFAKSNGGQLNFIWFDAANFEPVTVDNGAPLFEVCFKAIGELDECTRLEFPSSIPTEGLPILAEIISASSQEELNIIDEGKDICITPFGIEADRLEQPDCGGDGSVEVRMAGGTGYFGNWILFLENGTQRDVPQNASLPNRTLNFDGLNSSIDSVCLTVFDRTDSNLNDRLCWTIKIDDERVPIALAGEDLETGCGTPEEIAVELVGNFEFGDADTTFLEEQRFIDYEWKTIDGIPVDPFNPGQQSVTVSSAGKYVLTVRIRETGCSAADTVEVFRSQTPTVVIDEIESITCKRNTVELVGQSVETGLQYAYEWRDESGEKIPGNSVFEAEANQGGIYTFVVTNTDNNCVSEETVVVTEEKTLPKAEAGGNMLKRCGDRFVELNGTESAIGARIEYEWTTSNGSGIFNNTGQTPQVSKVGTYYIEVTDVDNGCSAIDSVRVEADPELPVALARPKAFLGCGEAPVAVLDGSPSREFTNANFFYTWEKEGTVIIEGNETAILDQTTVRDTGDYLLIIVNTANDLCVSDTAIVNVSIDDIKPQANVPTNITVGCSGDCVDLPANTGSLSSLFQYEWSTEDGVICGGETTAISQISGIGTYQLILTNTANNCSDTTKVFIFPDEENAVGADAGASRVITCTEEMVALNGSGSSKEPSHVYEWQYEGQKISDSLVVMVDQVGTYELIVSDTETGCVANASVKVTRDQELPKVDAGEDIMFMGCDFPSDPPISLVATNSISGEEYEIAWTTDGGSIIGDTSSTITTIGAPGVYILTITNKETGCTSFDEVVVSSTVDNPVAIIEPIDHLDCNTSSLTLDANGSQLTPNAIVEWTTIGGNIVSGEESLSPEIDAPGTYTLKITSANGCDDRTEVVVVEEESMIEADVVMDNLRIFCNEQMTIDGSGSTTGENVLISWTTTDGRIISGVNTLLPEIASGGTYLLTLEDTLSNCKVSKEVLVESDGDLPNALAGEDQEVCDREATLTAATITDNVSGRWTSLNNIVLDNGSDTEILVNGLSPGINTFVWSLSTNDCPEYTTDTVIVNVATVPVAREDKFTVTNDQSTVMLDLVQNDQTNSSFDVNVLTSIDNGDLTEVEEGIFEFNIPENFLGSQKFEYEICSKTCADICANATVSLAVRPVSLEEVEGAPNAITPNGDGKNDQLIFDELFFQDLNESELVLFNRWGDVVYQESPYNNDWQGLGLDGTELPEGTYYYILRLRIGEGEIIRGEVTVLR